jgi:hypothetical protein
VVGDIGPGWSSASQHQRLLNFPGILRNITKIYLNQGRRVSR